MPPTGRPDLDQPAIPPATRRVLGPEGMDRLADRLRAIRLLNQAPYRGPLRAQLLAGDAMPAGTLLHGLYNCCDVETLESILADGVLSGDVFGIQEDGETFGCADFYRVTSDATLGEYFDEAFRGSSVTLESGATLKVPGQTGTRNVVVIIDAQALGMDDAAQHDAYRNPAVIPQGTLLRATPEPGRAEAPPLRDDLAALFGGVPRCAIAAVVIGDDYARRAPQSATAMRSLCASQGLPVLNHAGRVLERGVALDGPTLDR